MRRFDSIFPAIAGMMFMTADTATGGGAAIDPAAAAATTAAAKRDKSGTPVLYDSEDALKAADTKKGYSKFIVTGPDGAIYHVTSRASDAAIGFAARTKLGFNVKVFGKAPRGAAKPVKAEALLDAMTDEQRKALLAKYLNGGTGTAATGTGTPVVTTGGNVNASNANASATGTPAASAPAATNAAAARTTQQAAPAAATGGKNGPGAARPSPKPTPAAKR